MRDKKVSFIIIIILLVVYLGGNFYSSYKKKQRMHERYLTLQTKLREKQKRNEILKEKLKNKDDLEYIEKIPREKLNLIKPNEKIIQIKKDMKKTPNY